MTRRQQTTRALATLSLAAVALVGGIVFAQDAPPAPNPPAPQGGGFGGGGGGRGGGGWTTSRGDAQRTAWVTTDAYISVENLQTPGYFNLEWTVKLTDRAGERLSEGVTGNTAQLNPAPGDVAGSLNNVYGYEIDYGSRVWSANLGPAPAGPGTAACPSGLTSGVTRATSLTGGMTGGVLGRSGTPFGSARGTVGEPGQGVPPEILARGGGFGRRGAAPGAAAPGGAAPAGAARGGAAAGARGGADPAAGGGAAARGGGGPGPAFAGGGRGGGSPYVYAVTSDGQLRTVGQQQGKEIERPVAFLPPNANVGNIILVDDVLYATTINGCGGVANGVWAIDIGNENAVKSWQSGASPVGGVSFGTTGTIYVALGDGPAAAGTYANAIVALDRETLTVTDWFTMPGAAFATMPVVFSMGEREMVAAATTDGRVFLLDASSLGGANHQVPVAVSSTTSGSAPSALATWEDEAGTRWILVPTTGAQSGIAALKVQGNTLTAGWTSATALASPSAPIVVNGVVFAMNQGSGTTPARLYAFNAMTGQEIWNSGQSITAPSTTPLWSMSGQVHVATTDGVVYAFAWHQDRRLP